MQGFLSRKDTFQYLPLLIKHSLWRRWTPKKATKQAGDLSVLRGRHTDGVRKPSASAANFATKRQISKGDGGPANSNDL